MTRAVLPLAALTPARVPSPEASFAELAAFAWLDDRYERLEASGELDRLAPVWDASEPGALATDDLRPAMLLQQRRVYWEGGEAGERDERRMRALADELRRRLAAKEPARCAVWTGDLTRLAVDAIVNAANPRMLGGGGVDGAIHRAAGPELLAACRAVPEVEPGVRCPAGEARITPGFRLPARWVIHTVGPVWWGGDCDEDATLAQAYQSSLKVAAAHAAESVAFPAISTGVYGFPPERAARLATDVVREWQARHEFPSRVLLVAYDDEAADILQSAAESSSPSSLPAPMTPREITTDDGTRWTLVAAAADPDASEGQVTVVATPSGGEQTLRLALDPTWADDADDELAAAVAAARRADGRD